MSPIPVILGGTPDPPPPPVDAEARRITARLRAELREKGTITKAEVRAILDDQPDPTR